MHLFGAVVVAVVDVVDHVVVVVVDHVVVNVVDDVVVDHVVVVTVVPYLFFSSHEMGVLNIFGTRCRIHFNCGHLLEQCPIRAKTNNNNFLCFLHGSKF